MLEKKTPPPPPYLFILSQGIWNMTLFGKLADREDGRLMSQSNYLAGIWMSDSFMEPERERNNEELKSKGRIERERQNRKVETARK